MEVTPQAVRVVLAVAVVGFVWRAFEVTEKIDRGGGALALGWLPFYQYKHQSNGGWLQHEGRVRLRGDSAGVKHVGMMVTHCLRR
jgi:hypothetical protein